MILPNGGKEKSKKKKSNTQGTLKSCKGDWERGGPEEGGKRVFWKSSKRKTGLKSVPKRGRKKKKGKI